MKNIDYYTGQKDAFEQAKRFLIDSFSSNKAPTRDSIAYLIWLIDNHIKDCDIHINNQLEDMAIKSKILKVICICQTELEIEDGKIMECPNCGRAYDDRGCLL